MPRSDPSAAAGGGREAAFDESLLAGQAAGLRRLALSIVRDAAEAEDVVQDAYARSLVAPAPAGPAFIAWMRVVVRGLARNRLRDRSRRMSREASYTRERAAAAAEHDEERAATLRAVVDAVLALDEPYRRVGLARYFEGVDDTVIAARDGITVAAVATRLKRARARLRVSLEPRLGARPGGVGGALAVFAGLARRPAARAGVGAALARYFLLNAKKVALVSGVLAVLLLVLWVTREVSTPQLDVGSVAGGESQDADESELARSRSASGSTAVGAAQPDPTSKEVEPVVTASARPFSEDARAARIPPAELGRGPFGFHASFEACDRDGHPMAGARIVGAPRGTPLNELGITDWRGRLELEWRAFAPKSSWIVGARHPDEGRSALCELELVHESPNVVRLALRPLEVGEDFDLRGIEAALDGGAPVPEPVPAGKRSRSRRGLEKQRANTPSDLPAFRVDGQGNGEFCDPLLLAPQGTTRPAPLPQRTSEMQGRTLAVTLRAERGARSARGKRSERDELAERALEIAQERYRELLRGVEPMIVNLELVTSIGAPAAAIPVSVALAQPCVRVVGETDASGKLVLPLPPARELQLAYGGGATPVRVERIESAGPRIELRRELDRGEPLLVDLREANGKPVSGWTVEAYAADAPALFLGQARTGEDGLARLALATAAPARLLARRTPAVIEIAALLHEAAYPGASANVLSLPDELGSGGLRVRFTTAGGARPAQAEARLWNARSRQAFALFSMGGEPGHARGDAERWIGFDSPLIQSAIYVLEAGAAGQRWASFGEVRVPRGGVLDLGLVPFRDSAEIALSSAAHPIDGVVPAAKPGEDAHAEEVQLELRVPREGVLVRALAQTVTLPQRIEVSPCVGELTLTYRLPAIDPPVRALPAPAAGEPARTPASTEEHGRARRAEHDGQRVERWSVSCAPGQPWTWTLGQPAVR